MNLGEFEKECPNPQPVYYLITDQDYLRKRVFELAQQQVEEGARSFDWRVYDLENDSEPGVVQECRTPPWMSPYRWVFIGNAQLAKAELLEYLKRPSQRTVLILAAEKKPRGWPQAPQIEIPSGADAASWLCRKAKAEGFSMPSSAARALVELVGDDYQRLDSELEKLLLRHWDSRRISRDDVLEMTQHAREFDVFSLIGTMAAGNAQESLSILARLFEEGMAPPQILALLHWNFRRLLVAREWLAAGRRFDDILRTLKIWSYRGRERQVRSLGLRRLRKMLLRLQQTDRLAKSTSLDGRTLVERFVIDTCRS